MKTLAIDIETHSSVDLGLGIYKYTESDDFKILLFAYKIDDEPAEVIDLTENDLPKGLIKALTDENIVKTAYNAQFECVCLDRYLGIKSVNWDCTMIKAWTLGIPGTLDTVSRAIGISEDDAKIKEGKRLIKTFCKNRIGKNYPYTKKEKPEDWELFKDYCKRDVEVETYIREKLSSLPYTREKELYALDQKINSRGIEIDKVLASKAISLDKAQRQKYTTIFKSITGIDSPNQIGELKKWLSARNKGQIDQITKVNKDELFDLFKDDKDATAALECRYKTGKTSTAKYDMMMKATGKDGRMRGTLQFYGAQTGRWAGRLLQVQNLPQNHIPDLDTARDLIKLSDYAFFSAMYDDPQDVLSQCIRPAIVPAKGKKFVVADYSAIEARVIAWLAKEDWVLDVFRTTGKIYEATAAKMLGVPVEKIKKGSPERQKGKVATLACIAKGSLVLTNKGLIPIEKITTNDKVWDGENWVSHDGVVYKGMKEVISYEGLTATKDHIVWIEDHGEYKSMEFEQAKKHRYHLVQTGAGRRNLRLGEHNKPPKNLEKRMAGSTGFSEMQWLRKSKLGSFIQSKTGQVKRLPKLFTKKSCPKVAIQKIQFSPTKMRKSAGSRIQKLWRPRNKVQICISDRRGEIHDRDKWVTTEGIKVGNRSNRQRRTLRARKFAMGNSGRTNEKCKTIYKETYDIINAGKKHRYTVNNVLVHNCGYQGGIGALKVMGALKMGIPENELQNIIDDWRASNPNIVNLWYEAQNAVKSTVIDRQVNYIGEHVKTFYKRGYVFIELPSGRLLSYPKMTVRSSAKFEGADELIYGIPKINGEWRAQPTYGGRLIENIVQATARDVLASAMLRLDKAGYDIVMHIHDEVVIEAPIDDTTALSKVIEIMTKGDYWNRGLPLNADGYECNYYKKD